MRDISKIILTLFVQLRQCIDFIEKHRHDFILSDDEEIMLRGLLNVNRKIDEKCAYEFDREVSGALADMIDENDWWRGFKAIR